MSTKPITMVTGLTTGYPVVRPVTIEPKLGSTSNIIAQENPRWQVAIVRGVTRQALSCPKQPISLYWYLRVCLKLR